MRLFAISPALADKDDSVSVRVSLEEKEMRVFAISPALALTLTLFQYPEGELNPHDIAATGV